MIKGILEEFFAVTAIIIVIWFASRTALNLYKKFWDIKHTTREKSDEKVSSDSDSR